MPKRKLTLSPTPSSDSTVSAETDWIQPFKKKVIDYDDRKAQKDKALATISKFLSISDKYAYQWKIQQQQMQDKIQPFSENPIFIGKLKDYQEVGVKWMETLFLSGINGILADEMGLGKTVQVIAFLCLLHSRNIKGMHLIIVPLSTVPNWVSEFQRFAPIFPVIRYHGDLEERMKAKEVMQKYMNSTQKPDVYPIVIVPQHFINKKEIAFFQNIKFLYVIMDEGHRIKNHKSDCSMAIRTLKCSNKLLLTGTPLQNNMIELWSLLNFIMPAIFSNVEAFDHLIQAGDLSNEQVINSDLKENETIVQTVQRILEPFMLRRLKANVLPDNIPKKDVLVYCDMTEQQLDMYTYVLEKKLSKLRGDPDEGEINLKREDRRRSIKAKRSSMKEDMFRKSNQMHNISFTNPLMLFKRVVNHPFLISAPMVSGTKQFIIDERIVQYSGKMKVLDALLQRLIARGHKTLIFSTLVIMLEIIADYLNMRNLKFSMLVGADSLEVREQSMHTFNNDPDTHIFLLSTRAGGLGLNLTAADTVIFYDRDWNPQTDMQAAARCHRIGQTKPVMIYTLISKNSIDEYIIKCGDLKMRLQNLVMYEGKRGSLDEQKKTTQDLLDSLKKKDAVTVHPNGLTYSNEELDALLDRSEIKTETTTVL